VGADRPRPPGAAPARRRGPLFFALLSLGVGFAVLGLKLGAYLLTGSVALFSDALESIINVVAALAATLSIRLADKPPDLEHPYGHGKAEYFSAVAEGVLIILAAATIIYEAAGRLAIPAGLESVGLGLSVSLLASLLNGGLAVVLLRNGRRVGSPALTADGYHVLADVWTSVGVLVGVVLAAATRVWELDPLLAIAVAANIVRVGWQTVYRSVGGLMDAGLPEPVVGRIRAAIEDNLDGALEVHALRTRQSGRQPFVGCHLVVPGGMSVAEAHDICDRIEAALLEVLPGASITIHIEPEDMAELHGGERVGFVGRGSPARDQAQKAPTE
jgi:cation diffusion facilitator family transporter